MEMNTPEGFALMNWETGYGDWVAEPVWDTLRVLPWLEKTALVLADAADERDRRGDPGRAADDPQAPGRAGGRGRASRVKAGSEFEYYVLKDSWEEPGRARLAGPTARSATTTRTTSCSRRRRPNRSTGCCATR